jgi:predicted nucleotidyltransferase
MSLLRDVVAVLEAQGIDHALIGAAAMAVHGVSRATADIDLFTVDDRVLQAKLWRELEGRGAGLRLLQGDLEDPLAGSVRLTLAGDRTVDVVVGRYAWQKTIVESAEKMPIGEVTVKVARPAGLILLKLYAGGPKDAWDIRSLMESHEEAASIEAEVDQAVPRLPAESRDLWKRLCDER